MRVMLVAQTDVTQVIGGLERHVLMLAHELQGRGLTATVVVPGGRSPQCERVDGIEVRKLPASFRYADRLYRAASIHPQHSDPVFVRHLSRLIADWQPTVVHSHGNVHFSVGPCSRRASFKWLHTLHDYGLVCPKATLSRAPSREVCQRGLNWGCLQCHARESAPSMTSYARAGLALSGLVLSRRRMRLADRYLAVSAFVAEAHVERIPALAHRLTVCPEFQTEPAHAETSWRGPNARFALYVGSAAEVKGVHLAVEAFRDLPGEAALVALVAGPEHWISRLEAAAGSRVIIQSNVPHADVMTAWRQATLGIVPSIWPDPCPIVALEAMSLRKPLVASAIGGLTDEIDHGETGLLVPPGDVAALRRAIGSLMYDDDMCERLGGAARAKFEAEFSTSAVVDRIVDTYSAVATGGATLTVTD